MTRVRGSQQLTEQFAQTTAGVTAAMPIDLGAATGQEFLILYGSNLGMLGRPTQTPEAFRLTCFMPGR